MKQNESLPEEYLLACRAKAGDQEALGVLAERLRVSLFGLAYAELRHYDDAQDVVAAALLQICLHIKELREPARMRSWTWEVARNEVRRFAVKRRSRLQSEMTWQLLEQDTDAQFPAVNEQPQTLRLDIERALQNLPQAQSDAASLHYLLGHSIDEIAERLGRPPGTVKSWLHHARHRLALEMEDYSPVVKDKLMPNTLNTPNPTTTPEASASANSMAGKTPLKAVIVQTDMEVSVLTRIREVLSSSGFQVRIATADEVYQALNGSADNTKGAEEAWDPWFPLSLLVMDEVILGRPALEFLVTLKAQLETQAIPICVLLNAAPSPLTAAAYFGAGAARLLVKTAEETYAALGEPQEKRTRVFSWVHFTEKARRVVFEAQKEARRFKHSCVAPEHLLLGLTSVPDSVGARILTEKMGLSLKTLRDVIEQDAPQGTDETQGDMQLDPQSKRAIDLAYEEAGSLGNSYIGGEHLLLGLFRGEGSLAARALASQGVELETTRALVRQWQQNPQ